MKISLIIPAFNEEKYIRNCLERAIESASITPSVLEIIVVDNSSTDGTSAIAKSFRDVKVVFEPNKGLTKARQRGLLEAKGDIVAYVDADTLMPKNWFTQIIKEYESRADLVCISGPYEYYDISTFRKFLVKIYWRVLALPVYFALGYMAVGGNFAVRKSAVEAIGGFDTNISSYGEDTNIARRLSKKGKVRFTMSLEMLTSGRRLNEQGILSTAITYATNYISEALLHRPITRSHTDIR